MLLLKLKEIGLDERLNEDQKYTKFLNLKYFDKDAFENIVVLSASRLRLNLSKKKCYQQCCMHQLFDELYLTFHSNFSLIRGTFNFWFIITKYRRENVDFDEKINDERINRYLNEELDIKYWNRKLI